MKKIFILLFLATVTTFVSCNKDDDTPPPAPTTAELIVGSWEFSKQGMIVGGTEYLEDYQNNAPQCGKDYIVINNDNTGADYYFDFDTQCVTDVDTFTYTLNGNAFSIVYSDGETLNGTVMHANHSSLKIKVTEESGGIISNYVTVFNRK